MILCMLYLKVIQLNFYSAVRKTSVQMWPCLNSNIITFKIYIINSYLDPFLDLSPNLDLGLLSLNIPL